MIKFLNRHKGKLGALFVDIGLLCWWVPWHYSRFVYMVESGYERYMIQDLMTNRIFFTVFAIVLVFIIGWVGDYLDADLDG